MRPSSLPAGHIAWLSAYLAGGLPKRTEWAPSPLLPSALSQPGAARGWGRSRQPAGPTRGPGASSHGGKGGGSARGRAGAARSGAEWSGAELRQTRADLGGCEGGPGKPCLTSQCRGLRQRPWGGPDLSSVTAGGSDPIRRLFFFFFFFRKR